MPKYDPSDHIIVHGVRAGNLLRVGSDGNIEDGLVPSIQVMLFANAVDGNVAQFDENGQVEDSSIKAAEVVQLSAANQAKLANVLVTNDVVVHSADGAIAISGVALITGGEGISGLTLAAPTPGCRCEIRIDSLNSGNVVVTCAAGVTLDGTNDIATFDAVAEALVLGYKSATQWQIIENVGSVALSATP